MAMMVSVVILEIAMLPKVTIPEVAIISASIGKDPHAPESRSKAD